MNRRGPGGAFHVRIWFTGALVMSLQGCITVGPDYDPVAPPAPDAWTRSGGAAARAAALDSLTGWWIVFDDPQLTAVVERSVEGNLDVRAALSRIRQARASLGISRADAWPVLTASGSATRSQSSEGVGTGEESSFYRAGFDAGWELDLFGGTRRSIEAAVSELESRHADLDDALVSISAEVAITYVGIRSLQNRLAIPRSNLTAQQESFELAQFRSQAGLTTQLDVEQARSNLESTRAQIPALESQLAQTEHTLALLLGEAPGVGTDGLSIVGPVPTAPADVAVGVPAEVLRRRPDVRAAERVVAARSALIGVATAQLYPQFRLSGSIGLESLALDGFVSSDMVAWNGGPSFSLPIFNRAKLRRSVDVQRELYEQAVVGYEATVLGALAEVEDALVALRTEQQRQVAYGAAAAAAERSVTLSLNLYGAGLRDFQSVLDAQRSLFSFQDLLASSEAQVTTNLIRLYKALGGGWQGVETDGL